jgi:N-acetylmuramoyl-L-alanine amidase
MRRDDRPNGARQVVTRPVVAALGLLLVASGCGSNDSSRPAAAASTATRTPEFSVSSTFSLPPAPGPVTPSGGPSSPTPVPTEQPLAGKTILLDPGHNGGNAAHPEIINRKVDAGGFQKECDTTGTATNPTPTRPSYSESEFTLDVAQRTAALLKQRGAKVVMTRTLNSGVGPCIDERAAAGNKAQADAAVSIHADGGPPNGVGFHVIRPGLLPGRNDDVVGDSRSLSEAIHDALLTTGEPPSNYIGSQGFDERTDLGGLNLSTVPKVFVETGNMRNSADAARLTDPAFRQKLAVALADGLGTYLFGR